MIDPAAEQLTFRTLLHSQMAFAVEAGLFVIRGEDEWLSTWEGWRGSRQSAPAVDWAGELVVALALGSRPASGYQVTIEQLAVRDRRLYVNAWEEENGGTGLDIITHPVHAVAVPRRDFAGEPHLVKRVTVWTDED
ncbi:protease complex subunit PrcB family protein [Micromonospora mangrovi]|uniref:Protease complex subunit PrcB family protein n=1 Tax=Micromonospora sp. CCTCC AA 2012012 TaxID=3111921 RepID=A0AAU8HGP2_9ACTN